MSKCKRNGGRRRKRGKASWGSVDRWGPPYDPMADVIATTEELRNVGPPPNISPTPMFKPVRRSDSDRRMENSGNE
jgi:hypothetical protein